MGHTIIDESDRIHTKFKIIEQEEHFALLEDLQIHYLELSKLPKKRVGELEGLEIWLYFLKEAGKEGNEERIRELRERSETMDNAMKKLEEISADEKMLEIYRAREKARLDMISKLKYAEKKGREEGKEEGREEERKELARNLLLDGMKVSLVAKYTKLANEEVEDIKGKI